ncbi:DNA-deoxyinosine glycosylase [Croceicoccus gelatinilyticus]|uniref:DNA-deoxyinosine glycosylase n=1 Tax=Croceicoccus gelatinilyticus TaxID=2835536 RepID=UPI0030803D38
MTRKSSFPPVVRADTRLLLLGSLPGEASLRAARYYAHPQNRFWHLVGAVIGVDLPALDYDARLGVLLDHRIGLWDVVKSGRREGSLDAALREVEGNPLAELVQNLPDLAAIGFNGGTAAHIGRRLVGAGTPLTMIDLPSSSPAFAAMSLAEKTARWLALRPFLTERKDSNRETGA